VNWRVPRLKVRRETLLFLICLLIAMIATFATLNTTMNVTSLSESIAIEAAERMPRWFFTDVKVIWNGDSPEETFSGSLQFVHGDRINVERISTGPLRVTVSRMDDNSGKTGDAFSPNELFLRSFGSGTVIRIDNLEGMAKNGQNVVLAFSGTVTPASNVQGVPSMTAPVLKAGTIQILGHSIMSESLYRGESVPLGLGDNVVIEEPVGPAIGFVVADETAGLNLTYRQLASRARVVHLPANGYIVDLSVADRLKNDRTLQLLWLATGFLWAIPKAWKDKRE